MKFLETSKDGGPESTVWAHWLIELKGLFSIALLRFEGNSREAYHTHAFNCISWLLKGELREHRDFEDGLSLQFNRYWPSLKPIITTRDNKHKVDSVGTSWVLTFRGPWAKTWRESVKNAEGGYTDRVLANGRKVLTNEQ